MKFEKWDFSSIIVVNFLLVCLRNLDVPLSGFGYSDPVDPTIPVSPRTSLVLKDYGLTYDLGRGRRLSPRVRPGVGIIRRSRLSRGSGLLRTGRESS